MIVLLPYSCVFCALVDVGGIPEIFKGVLRVYSCFMVKESQADWVLCAA